MKKVLKILGLLLALGVLGTAGVVWFFWNQEQEHKAEQKAVAVSAEYNTGKCRNDSPILVTINNGTPKTVKSVNFRLHAFEDGRSDDLISTLDPDSLATQVIPPTGTRESCWRLGAFKRKVVNEVHLRPEKEWPGVTFYQEGEFIPASTDSPKEGQ